MRPNKLCQQVALTTFGLTAAIYLSASSTMGFSPVTALSAQAEPYFSEPELIDFNTDTYSASVVSANSDISSHVAYNFFEVMYDVPLVVQQTGNSCWAAGAAMLYSWKHQMSYSPLDISEATGHDGGLLPDDVSIFPMFDMVAEPAQSYSVSSFKDMLETYGPLWVASDEPLTSAGATPHIRVVTGIRGDGTPDGTYVYINDPWERGMNSFRSSNRGSQYYETYAEFIRKQADLGYQETHSFPHAIYVAHLR